LSDRSIGLEQEFFLVEESGEPSVRADEFLERCRERSEDAASCLAPEWVKGVVEVNTPPSRSLSELEGAYSNNVLLALRSAREIGLRLYPLGTYPLPLEPAVREEPDYRVQAQTVGAERFMDAGRCAGTHLHLGLPAGTVDTESGVASSAPEGARRELVDLHNLATALDPALIFLTRSCPFYEGRLTGLSPRTARYRGSESFGWDGVYRHLPEVGALLPYAGSPEDLVRQQFDRYKSWLSAMGRAGLDLRLFVESGGDLLRPAWNPVRLNRQGTLELRGMDANLPEITLAAVELVVLAAERLVREGLTVSPGRETTTLRIAGDRLLVPAFRRLSGELFRAAVAGASDDRTMTGYLDAVLDFAGGGPRLEKLVLRRRATGLYQTTEAGILGARAPHKQAITREEGLRLVLWACDELEDQASALLQRPDPGVEPAEAE
jgi:carboxylate-amine ligase